MSATDQVRELCEQLGGALHPDPCVTDSEWRQWLQGYGGLGPASERCPECGDRVVERSGAYGRFVGCESYPDCRFTRSVS